MANITSVLKEEIDRVARKEIRRAISSLKKSSTIYVPRSSLCSAECSNSSADGPRAFSDELQLCGPSRPEKRGRFHP